MKLTAPDRRFHGPPLPQSTDELVVSAVMPAFNEEETIEADNAGGEKKVSARVGSTNVLLRRVISVSFLSVSRSTLMWC